MSVLPPSKHGLGEGGCADAARQRRAARHLPLLLLFISVITFLPRTGGESGGGFVHSYALEYGV